MSPDGVRTAELGTGFGTGNPSNRFEVRPGEAIFDPTWDTVGDTESLPFRATQPSDSLRKGHRELGYKEALAVADAEKHAARE